MRKKECLACDWECFRDPSELMGPFFQLFENPLSLYRKYHQEKNFFRLWFDDLKYYLECDFFDGRKSKF